MLSEFFLDGMRGLWGIRVSCLGKGVTEGVLAFAIVGAMVIVV